MWHATKHRKIERMLGQQSAGAPAAWQRVLQASEDLLTSTVFERLAYLPDSMAVEMVLRRAEVNTARFVPLPEVIRESHPWPIPSEDERKEPDWVWVTDSYIWVFEAKWGINVVPEPSQLADQKRVCRQRWPLRPMIQVAVVQSGSVVFPPDVDGLTITWSNLLQALEGGLSKAEAPWLSRLLLDAADALRFRGLDRVFLDSLLEVPVHGVLPPLDVEQPTSWLPPVLEEAMPDLTLAPW